MSIENMTIGEARQIAAMFANTPATTPHIFNRFVGQFCIIRASSAGVHAGEIVSVQGDDVVARDVRRLWKWKANNGIALSGVATSGVVRSESKIDACVPEHAIFGVCELIPCTPEAKESINGK